MRSQITEAVEILKMEKNHQASVSLYTKDNDALSLIVSLAVEVAQYNLDRLLSFIRDLFNAVGQDVRVCFKNSKVIITLL